MSSIAIIGTGISGMAAAYLLHAKHDITVYEKDSVIGGHTRTLNINYDGIPTAVDTGFIVYNKRNYPNLTGLFRHLGVATQKSNMTFGVSADNGAMEWGAQNINSVFGQRSNLVNPSFYRMLRDVAKFNHNAVVFSGGYPGITLGEMLKKMKMGDWFMRYYLLPMGGAIWSCSPSQMLEFPAETFIRFFDNHGLLTVTQQPQWYTVTGGSQEYVKKITASYADRIRTGCGASLVKRESDGVAVADTQGKTQKFDRVIFACHANQALALLSDPTDQERLALSAIGYQKNVAVLHSDTSFMPKRRRCWSSWVYNVEGKGDEADIGITYWMNLLQSLDNSRPLFVTLNPARPVDESKVFDRHEFEHPVFTHATVRAQSQIGALQGQNNTWYCGAHLGYGFHEDGLKSAVNLAQAWGETIPWL